MIIVYIILYLIFAVIFTQSFSILSKSSKNHGTLTCLIEIIGGLSALIFIWLYDYKISNNLKEYLSFGGACIFYALADRINTTVRSGVSASTFSILQQLSTCILVILGIIFLKEEIVILRIVGCLLIIISNVLVVSNNKGKFTFNKYIILGIISSLCYAIALFIDVNISSNFNLALYVALTLLISSLLVKISSKIKYHDIYQEYLHNNKKLVFITGISWSLMIICQLRSYQLAPISKVAPILSLNVILNVLFDYFFMHNKDNLLKKIIASGIIFLGIILVKS